MWPSFPLNWKQIRPEIFPFLMSGLFGVKTHDYGQVFHFYRKTKHKASGKTSRQCFLKELKGKCSKCEPTQQQQAKMHYMLAMHQSLQFKEWCIYD